MHCRTVTLLSALLTACMLSGCGVQYTINGRVVDAQTHKPVEGAVVAINWQRYKLLSPPGLGPDRVEYGTTDSVTDAEGNFAIEKYSVGEFYMGVYKQGYICWSNENGFNPRGRTNEEMYLPSKAVPLHNGMRIELQPIENVGFPFLEHARFISILRSQIGSRKFSDATRHADDFYYQERRKRIGKKK